MGQHGYGKAAQQQDGRHLCDDAGDADGAEKRGDRDQQRCRLRGRCSGVQQQMMQMPTIRRHRTAPCERASNHQAQRVDERNGDQPEQRGKHRRAGPIRDRLRGQLHDHRRHRASQHHAAGIAHEGEGARQAGAAEIEDQESQHDGEQQQAIVNEPGVTGKRARQGKASKRHRRNAARQPIESIDHVEGIDDADNEEKRDRYRQPSARRHESGQVQHAAMGGRRRHCQQYAGHRQLKRELHRRSQLPPVVRDADRDQYTQHPDQRPGAGAQCRGLRDD